MVENSVMVENSFMAENSVMVENYDMVEYNDTAVNSVTAENNSMKIARSPESGHHLNRPHPQSPRIDGSANQ